MSPSGDHQDVSLHRQVFQKGRYQEIKKNKPKAPPFKTLKTTRAPQPQDLKKLLKKKGKKKSIVWFIHSFCMSLPEFNALGCIFYLFLFIMKRLYFLLCEVIFFLIRVRLLTKPHSWQPNVPHHQACDETSGVTSAGI